LSTAENHLGVLHATSVAGEEELLRADEPKFERSENFGEVPVLLSRFLSVRPYGRAELVNRSSPSPAACTISLPLSVRWFLDWSGSLTRFFFFFSNLHQKTRNPEKRKGTEGIGKGIDTTRRK
jgi:hypothetical protein